MQKNRKKIVLQFLKLIVSGICVFFIIENYFFEINLSATPVITLSLLAIVILDGLIKKHPQKINFRQPYIPLIFIALFFTVLFRTSTYWALNTFPLKDAYSVLLTLQAPFDDFAYFMVKQYLTTTIPQVFAISTILTVFAYVLLGSNKKRLFLIMAYFSATVVLFTYEVPVLDYIHILKNEPEKNVSYSKFFAVNYVNPDSIIISPPEKKEI